MLIIFMIFVIVDASMYNPVRVEISRTMKRWIERGRASQMFHYNERSFSRMSKIVSSITSGYIYFEAALVATIYRWDELDQLVNPQTMSPERKRATVSRSADEKFRAAVAPAGLHDGSSLIPR